MRWCLAILLTVLTGSLRAEEPKTIKPITAALSSEALYAQVVILVYDHLLQPEPPNKDGSLGGALKDLPQSGPGADLPVALRPLSSKLTIENTQAKLIESIRNELGRIGVQVTGVSVQSYPTAVEQKALEEAVVSAPHRTALIVVTPRLELWGGGRQLLLEGAVDIFPPDSMLLRVASGCGGPPSKPLEGSDPLSLWGAENGARFFQELGRLDDDCGRDVAHAFQMGAANGFGTQ